MTAVIDRPQSLLHDDLAIGDGPRATVGVIEPAPADGITDDQLTDDDLTAQALAADPDLAVDGDLPPWSPHGTTLMPDWYMPAGLPRRQHGWRFVVAVTVLVGLLAINAAGLCITYGHLVVA